MSLSVGVNGTFRSFYFRSGCNIDRSHVLISSLCRPRHRQRIIIGELSVSRRVDARGTLLRGRKPLPLLNHVTARSRTIINDPKPLASRPVKISLGSLTPELSTSRYRFVSDTLFAIQKLFRRAVSNRPRLPTSFRVILRFDKK